MLTHAIRAYVAVSCVGNMTMLHINHIGLEDPGWLCKVPENLTVHTWLRNPEEPECWVMETITFHPFVYYKKLGVVKDHQRVEIGCGVSQGHLLVAFGHQRVGVLDNILE